MARLPRRSARAALAVAVASLGLAATGVGGASTVAPPAEAEEANIWLTERRVLNMAHGGGLHEVPQGTLYAYETAAARGANALEMDLHITLDGHVVAIHDSTVDRTTDGTGCVVAKTLDELKQLDAAHTFVPGEGPRAGRPVGQYTMRGIATGDVPPPEGFEAEDFTIATLEEIFLAVPDALMIMELKPTEVYQSHDCPGFVESLPVEERPDLAAEVARLIHEHDMADKVLVASFIDDLLHRFQALAPEVDTSFPVGESVDVYLAYLADAPLPNPNGHEAFQVPRSFEGIPIDRPVVEYARANGVAVHFWTINDPDEMSELLDWGVDGLITDRPQVLEGLLAERGDPQPVVGSEVTLLADGPTPSEPGQPVAFTAEVASAWPHPEVTGEVELRSGAQVLGTSALLDGAAGFTIADLPPGETEVVAVYAGSARVLASTSDPVAHLVQVPPDTTPSTTSTTTAVPPIPVDPAPAPADPQGSGGGRAHVGATGPAPTTAGGTLPVTGGGLSPLALAVGLMLAGGTFLAIGRARRRA